MALRNLDVLQQALIINEFSADDLGDFPNDKCLRSVDGMNAVRQSALAFCDDGKVTQQDLKNAAFEYSKNEPLENFAEFVLEASRVMDHPDRKTWLILILFYVFRDDVLEALNG